MTKIYKIGTEQSGHHGHIGRQGLVGGSLPRDGLWTYMTAEEALKREYQKRWRRKRYALSQYMKKRESGEVSVPPIGDIHDKKVVEFMQDYNQLPKNVSSKSVKVLSYEDERMSGEGRYPGSALRRAGIPNKEYMQKMFYIEDATCTVKVNENEYGNGDYKSTDIMVSWADEDGRWLGSETFTLNNTMEVDMDSLYLSTAAPAGTGPKLGLRQMVMLSAQGYTSARFLANATIGKYAWAKEGATAGGGFPMNRLGNKFKSWAKSMNVLSGNRSLASLFDSVGWPSFESMYDVATFDVSAIQIKGVHITNDDVPSDMELGIGKAFLLSGNGYGHWVARLDLTKLTF
ncbi:unnamed protein product [marine sediment metagenome]|uniref:Uncharacterized protein n=1 Tax=marine sediment metagenome TaxID=412755 RepID=X0S6I1_9ZZZZ